MIKKPAGILLHPMQADPFIEPINQAIANGTTVTTFAADSPKSKRVSYITSDNLAEAKFAAEEIVTGRRQRRICGFGESGPEQPRSACNCADRLFREELSEHEAGRAPGVQPGRERRQQGCRFHAAGQSEPEGALDPEAGSAEGAVAAVLEAKAKVLIMHADITPATLEQIKAGNIHMALSPNQGMQGYLGFVATFMAAHPDLIDPFNDYKASGYNPMAIPFADNGFAVITKENADSFDLNKYMEGRDPS